MRATSVAPPSGQPHLRRKLRAAEAKLITGTKISVLDVALSSGGSLHALHLPLTPQANKPVLVMLGGYGTGAASFAMALANFDALPETPFSSIYAIDMPYGGLSSPFAPPNGEKSTLADLVAYASDALDEFFAACGIAKSRCTLFGHSIGAYLLFNYVELRLC